MKRISALLLMFSSLTCLAQDNPVDLWQGKLQEFYASTPPIVIHLFFNQPMYAPGDTAYFRAAVVTAEEMLPAKGQQIIMLDLVNYKGEIKLHQELRVKDGWDGNQIIIPPDLEAGHYRIKAFNDWMRRSNTAIFFTDHLEIAGEKIQETAVVLQGLSYFPEGGYLVAGLKNKVVLQSFPNAGKGKVMDDQGNTVADFLIGQYGYGFFYLTPQADRRYTIILGNEVKPMTPAATNGIAVMLTNRVDSLYSRRILLQAPFTSLREEDLFAIVSGHGTIYYSAILQFRDKEYLAVDVPGRNLPGGISKLSIMRANGDELASRLLYTPQSHSLLPRLTISKSEVITRENISLALSVREKEQQLAVSKVSISVYDEDLFPKQFEHQSLQDYLSCVSASGTDEEQMIPPWDSPDADLFLVTRVWAWYTWKQVLTELPEQKPTTQQYQRLIGRVSGAISENEISANSKLTVYMESTGDLYQFDTDRQGFFNGPLLFDFYEKEEIFYRIERNGKKQSNAAIVPEEIKMTYKPLAPSLTTGQLNPYFQYVNQRNSVAQSFRFFGQLNDEKRAKEVAVNATLEDELWGADFEVDLDDYTIFPTMHETIHEIIPWLENRKRNGKDVLRMYLADRHTNGSENPTFIIDGILTDDADYFLSLKPVDVDKIKLVTKSEKLARLGALGKNGLVLVETKIPGNAAKVSRNHSTFFTQGLSRPVAFSSLHSWQVKSNRVPRMQPCLYWNAKQETNAAGETVVNFNAADDIGRFRVLMEGLTIDGRPFRVEETFRVNFGKPRP